MTSPAPSPGLDGKAPWRAGVGLKAQHYRDILEGRPDVGFFEVHAENYMGAGGPPHRYLEAIRRDYPLSIHGVGLSLGGAQPLDHAHLRRLRALLDRYQPALFSEHLAWSTHQSHFLNDLLPVPYTIEALQHVCAHVDEAQDVLGRRLLLENPSTYVEFAAGTFTEEAFIAEVVARTGCGLLVDVNNAYVSAVNHGRDPLAYLTGLPLDTAGEIHLAGFSTSHDAEGRRLLIDHHGDHVAEAVWDLYAAVLPRTGGAPTLLEWDNDVPSWQVLRTEAARADARAVAVGAALRTAGGDRATAPR